MEQLPSTLTSSSNGNAVDTMECSPPIPTKKKKKEFDFSRYPRRRIALMFLYLGWSYDGLVTQENTRNTIEGAILEALEKTKLIENREIATWSRCGRTDKGVSGFRQIGSVTVRSTDVNGEGVYWPEGSNTNNRVSTTTELPYDRILNQILPSDIRIIAWSPAKADFNARFECTSRAYIYLFPKGRLNIEAMQLASNLLTGHHDFRNFCVIDMNNARLKSSYERDLFEVQISPINNESGPYQMFQLKIRGSGFLWHQIRCIVAVLYEIGLGRETPNVISELLDVNKCPAKPQYAMAKDLPLCFFDATYSDDLFDWKSCVSREVLQKVFQQLQVKWCELETQASIVRQMLNEVDTFGFNFDHAEGMDVHIIGAGSKKNQCPLMKRPSMASNQAGDKEAFLSLSEVPTGVKTTGSQGVDDAVRVLRLINTSRLHQLQSQINECMSELQSMTADPKADVSMGRVGYLVYQSSFDKMSSNIGLFALTEEDALKMLACETHNGSTNVNFQMEQYVFKRRHDGSHVINVGKTWEKLLLAARAIAAVENPADVVVVSGRPYAQRALLKFAAHTGATPIFGRFTPGCFTNQIQKNFKEPRLLVISDPLIDHQAVNEASFGNLPVIGFVNTDSPLRYVDIAIPCNNKSKKSIGLLWWLLAREVLFLRGKISRQTGFVLDDKVIMPDLYFYREEQEKAEDEAKETFAANYDKGDDFGGQATAEPKLDLTAPAIGDWAATTWDQSDATGQPAIATGNEWGSAGATGW